MTMNVIIRNDSNKDSGYIAQIIRNDSVVATVNPQEASLPITVWDEAPLTIKELIEE